MKNASFNDYETYFSALNLTKWMKYTKDIGFSKLSKKINHQKLKEIFIKYEDKQKLMTYEAFKDAIQKILK